MLLGCCLLVAWQRALSGGQARIWWDVKKDARCEMLNEARVLKHVSTQATGR